MAEDVHPLFWATLDTTEERWGVGVPPYTEERDVPASALRADTTELWTRAYGALPPETLLTVRRYSDGVLMYTVQERRERLNQVMDEDGTPRAGLGTPAPDTSSSGP